MAVTLATINDTLVNQNDILKSTDTGVKNTSQNIDRLVSTLYADRLDKLESDKEGARDVKAKTDKVKGESRSGGGGLFGGLGNMFGGIGTALGSIPILGGFLTTFLKFSKLLLRFGPLAFVLGTIVQGMDTEELSRLFTNLGETFDKIKTTISKWWTDTDKWMTEHGIKLPSIKEVQTFIVDKFNGAIKGLNNILEGDFKTFGTDMSNIGVTLGLIAFAFSPLGFIGKAFALLSGSLKLAKKAVTGLAGAATAATVAPAATTATTTAAAAAATAATTKAVPVRNFTVDKAGNYTSTKTGKPLTGAALKTAQATQAADVATSSAKIAKKFPRFGSLSKMASKIPGIGALISGGLITSILMSDSPITEKVAGIAGVLGGLGGSVLGGIAGTLIFPGAGTIGGAILGGLAGDTIATGLAQWLLGQPVTAFGFGKSSGDSGNMVGATGDDPMNALGEDFKYTPKAASKPQPMNASVIGDLTAQKAEVEAMRRNNGGGSGAPIVIQDNSVRSSSNNSALALPPASAVDTRYGGGYGHSMGYIR